MIDVNGEIAKAIADRAALLDFGTVYKLIGGKPFLLAGGALCGDEVYDYDLYPDRGDPFDTRSILNAVEGIPGEAYVMGSSRNALTVRLAKKDQTVQFCAYIKPSLEDLVESFDFSHVQVGIRFGGGGSGPYSGCVFYTDAFVAANVTRKTEYTGSEYPLSSLIRLLKYHKRGKFGKTDAARAVVRIVRDMIERGYESYDDYKDQLDAVDLLYDDGLSALDLYETLKRKCLVAPKPRQDTEQ